MFLRGKRRCTQGARRLSSFEPGEGTKPFAVYRYHGVEDVVLHQLWEEGRAVCHVATVVS